MENYYVGVNKCPHHLSVGAVLLDDDKKVACHYYEKRIRNYPEKFFTLMHETVESGETLEDALHRGLMEEFAIVAEIISYVGSLVVGVKMGDQEVEKTVLYFVCKIKYINTEREDTEESLSEIKWLEIGDLIKQMKKQGEFYGLSSDESKILEDVKKYFIDN